MKFLHDLRIAVRSLRRAAGFTALTTSVLGLGLAVVVVMFAIMYEVSYEPPPLPNPETMVGIKTINRARNDMDNDLFGHDYTEWRRSQTVFEDMAGEFSGTVIVSGQGPAERYTGGFVTGSFMRLIGIAPMIGRGIEPRDTLPGAAPVVVLSQDLWRTRFNSDPTIIGRSLRVMGEVSTVVGVLPSSFMYPAGSQVWVPMREPYDAEARGEGMSLNTYARLKPGVSIDEAQAQMSVLAARTAKQFPETNSSIEPDVMPIALAPSGREDQRLFQMMFGSVFLVLIIACVNVAGLMLVRATGRTQEAGIRRALGAGRFRLIMQMMAESLVIGTLAGLMGLTIAAGALEALEFLLPMLVDDGLPPWWDFSVDGLVAAFAIVTALVSTIVAGIYPALRVSGLDVNAILREGTRDTGLSTGRIIRALVVVEIALSCALLTSAGILIRTAVYASSGDVGADVRPFMVGRIGLPESVYSKPDQVRFIDKLLPAINAIPGASGAVVMTSPPAWGTGIDRLALPGGTYAKEDDYPYAHVVSMSPGFFDAFRVPLLQGRDFTTLDREGTQPVAIVNESLAWKLWPKASALGQRLRLRPSNPESPWLTVVGVSRNVLHDDNPFQAGEAQPTAYVPLLQQPERFFSAVVRTNAADPHVLGEDIRRAVTRIDSEIPVYFMRTIPESRNLESGGLQILGGLFTSFGVITIILTACGIYGVLAYSVAQSAREIAIRRALGAPDRGIIRAIARRSGWQLGLGLLLGVLVAPVMAVGFSDTVGGNMHDPRIYTAVFVTLTLAIVAATALPLRRALSLQPITALRHT